MRSALPMPGDVEFQKGTVEWSVNLGQTHRHQQAILQDAFGAVQRADFAAPAFQNGVALRDASFGLLG